MSDRSTLVRNSIATVLGSLLKQEKGTARELTLKALYKASEVAFSGFSTELVCKISTPFLGLGKCRVKERVKEKVMKKFHKLRITTLPAVWKSFAEKLGLHCRHPALLQSVNRLTFNTPLIQYCSAKFAPTQPAHVQSGFEEENALCYACGYIPFKLMKRFEKLGTEKAAQFVECLSHMAVGGENEESSFYDYTCQWVKTIDRGGLFRVSDYGFMLFKAIEIKKKECLPQHLRSSAQSHSL